jgi:DNA polymerase-3 subunit alpha
MLETICGDTYGVMIYQEQVQNAAKLLAGYSLGGADILRRAMGKKKPSEMAKQREIFIKGAADTNQIDSTTANKIFDKIAGFAGYGFNKSHSACYGHISYWTAYLKANFPVEFLSGLLSNEINNTDKISLFIAECHNMKIEVLPPDINKSKLRFAPERLASGKMAIRYGLAAIKNVGEGAMAIAIDDRNTKGPFESMEDFSNRLDTKSVNKRILENLVKAGTFDWTGENRSSLDSRIENVIASASSAHKDRASGQVSLFETVDFGSAPEPDDVPGSLIEWPKEQRLDNEKELLGFYISGHPLDAYRGVIDSDMYTRIGLIDELDLSDRRKRHRFAGMIKHIEHKVTKAGKPFGVIHLEDFTGTKEILSWSESYTPAREEGLLEQGNVIRLFGNVQEDDRNPDSRRVSGSKIEGLAGKRVTGADRKALNITLWTSKHDENDLLEIKQILQSNPGKTSVLIHIQNSMGDRATLTASESFLVRKSDSLEMALAKWME